MLALAAIFGTCAFVSNAIAVFVLPDRLGRRKMLLTGCAWVVFTEIFAAVMQREFENTGNSVGKGFAIAGLYVFIIGYCEPSWHYHECKKLTQNLQTLSSTQLRGFTERKWSRT